MNRKNSKFSRKAYTVKPRKSILRRRTFWFSLGTIAILSACSYLFLFSSYFAVYKLQISGNHKIKATEIQNIIDLNISKNILLWHSHSIFLTNTEKLSASISSQFLAIDNVKIKKELPDTLNIIIEERKAVGVFCNENMACFNLDKNGIAFEDSTESQNLPLIESEAGEKEISIGENVMDSDTLGKILKIYGKVNDELKIGVTRSKIINSQRINFATADGWEIYFDPSANLDWQLTELDLVLKQEIPAQKLSTLEYIDLRFSKVYYRYK